MSSDMMEMTTVQESASKILTVTTLKAPSLLPESEKVGFSLMYQSI